MRHDLGQDFTYISSFTAGSGNILDMAGT